MTKNMKRLLIITSVIALLFVSYRTWFSFYQSSQPEVVITFPDGFNLEPLLADNQFEAKRGLSGIEDPTSMLFVFGYKTIISFWMKDMLFPIDIIWLDGNTVIGFEESLQPENPPTTLYQPKTPIDSALEVPAGFVEERKIAVGNQLDIKFANK